jgi:uncharacterized protein
MDTKLFLEAVQQGKLEEVQGMLAAQPALAAARSESGVSAVMLAAYYGQGAVARLLAGTRGDLSLFEASVLGDLEQVQALLAANPDQINMFSVDGFQALGFAVFFAQPAVARWLVEHGAEVNSPSRNGQRVPPLNSAAAGGNVETVRLLLEHGADPNGRQAGGFAPLHNAAQNGLLEMIDLLLARGAEINARAENGQTPLAFAVEARRTEAAARLRTLGGIE